MAGFPAGWRSRPGVRVARLVADRWRERPLTAALQATPHGLRRAGALLAQLRASLQRSHTKSNSPKQKEPILRIRHVFHGAWNTPSPQKHEILCIPAPWAAEVVAKIVQNWEAYSKRAECVVTEPSTCRFGFCCKVLNKLLGNRCRILGRGGHERQQRHHQTRWQRPLIGEHAGCEVPALSRLWTVRPSRQSG